ncbi:Ras GTPase [Blyttiomyces sp. JEL0837]|nr:Ras GTPase [Blyttiomyces sp. JEL0837]
MLVDEKGWITHLSILLIGPAHVGKTELINSFVTGGVNRKPAAPKISSSVNTNNNSATSASSQQGSSTTSTSIHQHPHQQTIDPYIAPYDPTIEDSVTIQFLLPPNPQYTAPFQPLPPPLPNAYMSATSSSSSSSSKQFQQQQQLIDKESEYQAEERLRQNRQRIVLTVIDVGGHPLYSGLWSSVAVAADAVMLVYDVGDRRSFDTMWSFHRKISEAKGMILSDIPVMLVGNMVDTVSGSNREVSFEMGQSFANLVHIPFMETTAKAPQSVGHVFKKLIAVAQSHVFAMTKLTPGPVASKTSERTRDRIFPKRASNDMSDARLRVPAEPGVNGGMIFVGSTSVNSVTGQGVDGGSVTVTGSSSQSAWKWLRPDSGTSVSGSMSTTNSTGNFNNTASIQSAPTSSLNILKRIQVRRPSEVSLASVSTSSSTSAQSAVSLSFQNPGNPPGNVLSPTSDFGSGTRSSDGGKRSFLGSVERMQGSLDRMRDSLASSSGGESNAGGVKDATNVASSSSENGSVNGGGSSSKRRRKAVLAPPMVGSIRHRRDLILRALQSEKEKERRRMSAGSNGALSSSGNGGGNGSNIVAVIGGHAVHRRSTSLGSAGDFQRGSFDGSDIVGGQPPPPIPPKSSVTVVSPGTATTPSVVLSPVRQQSAQSATEKIDEDIPSSLLLTAAGFDVKPVDSSTENTATSLERAFAYPPLAPGSRRQRTLTNYDALGQESGKVLPPPPVPVPALDLASPRANVNVSTSSSKPPPSSPRTSSLYANQRDKDELSPGRTNMLRTSSLGVKNVPVFSLDDSAGAVKQEMPGSPERPPRRSTSVSPPHPTLRRHKSTNSIRHREKEIAKDGRNVGDYTGGVGFDGGKRRPSMEKSLRHLDMMMDALQGLTFDAGEEGSGEDEEELVVPLVTTAALGVGSLHAAGLKKFKSMDSLPHGAHGGEGSVGGNSVGDGARLVRGGWIPNATPSPPASPARGMTVTGSTTGSISRSSSGVAGSHRYPKSSMGRVGVLGSWSSRGGASAGTSGANTSSTSTTTSSSQYYPDRFSRADFDQDSQMGSMRTQRSDKSDLSYADYISRSDVGGMVGTPYEYHQYQYQYQLPYGNMVNVNQLMAPMSDFEFADVLGIEDDDEEEMDRRRVGFVKLSEAMAAAEHGGMGDGGVFLEPFVEVGDGVVDGFNGDGYSEEDFDANLSPMDYTPAVGYAAAGGGAQGQGHGSVRFGGLVGSRGEPFEAVRGVRGKVRDSLISVHFPSPDLLIENEIRRGTLRRQKQSGGGNSEAAVNSARSGSSGGAGEEDDRDGKMQKLREMLEGLDEQQALDLVREFAKKVGVLENGTGR